MKKFGFVKMHLKKDVKKGDEESLLSIFSDVERSKSIKVLTDAEEGTIIKVNARDLGEIDLELGNDIERGQGKTILTLFTFAERSKKFKITRKAKIGQSIKLEMLAMPNI